METPVYLDESFMSRTGRYVGSMTDIGPSVRLRIRDLFCFALLPLKQAQKCLLRRLLDRFGYRAEHQILIMRLRSMFGGGVSRD